MERLRDLVVGVTFNDKATDKVQKLDRQVDKVKFGFGGLTTGISRAETGAKTFGKNAAQSMKNVESTTDILSRSFVRLGGIIAGAFALNKLKDFGVGIVQASAEAQAMNAQFEQVFQDLQDEAQSTINKLGNEFGMLPNRIKPAFSQVAAQFQGLGLSQKEAMEQAALATQLAADAAAFYDKSMEDAQSALNSFIKGNYEGGESIGLFANETQLASWASKNLGLEWKKLGEAEKQVARLQFAKAMQESSGATGQAARESNSLANQVGNLRQAWEDFKANVGAPLLEPVVGVIGKMASALAGVNIEPFTSGLQKVINFGTNIGQKVWPYVQNGIAAVKNTVMGFVNDVVIPLLPQAQSVVTTVFNAVQPAINTAINLFHSAKNVIQTLVNNVVVPLFPVFKDIVSTGFNVISPILRIASSLFKVVGNTIVWLVNNVVKPLIPVIVPVIKGMWNKVKPILTGLSSIFNGIADAIQWVIDKFNNFTSALKNFKMPKIGLPKWLGGEGLIQFPGHAIGLSRVPYDNYVARLHKNETVLRADQSRALESVGILDRSGATPKVQLGSQAQQTTSKTAGGIQFSPKVDIHVYGADIKEAGSLDNAVNRKLDEMWKMFLDLYPVEVVR